MYKRQDIVNVVRYADELDIAVNVYLEDWSNGMKDSSDYVFQLMDGLKDTSCLLYTSGTKDTPLVCSPSRSVVSMISILTLFPMLLSCLC